MRYTVKNLFNDKMTTQTSGIIFLKNYFALYFEHSRSHNVKNIKANIRDQLNKVKDVYKIIFISNLEKQNLPFCCQSKTIPFLFCAIIKNKLNFPVFSTRSDDIIVGNHNKLETTLKPFYEIPNRAYFVKQKMT